MDPYDDANEDRMNDAEKLISHAMSLTSNLTFGKHFNVGFDLKQVRFAKVYVVGEPAQTGPSSIMGSTAIVEAEDESGKTLGSFVGGYLVSRCK
jgi:hypothetical protein